MADRNFKKIMPDEHLKDVHTMTACLPASNRVRSLRCVWLESFKGPHSVDQAQKYIYQDIRRPVVHFLSAKQR